MKKVFSVLILAFAAMNLHAADVNVTASPDSSMVAFTRDNDLWVRNTKDGSERRLTSDGTDVILNGYASWVYYEEIFGRPSQYRAFWWSPDGRKLAFYRFDNSRVPMFPIYSPFGQDGSLSRTRYPKAGETNPGVKIGFVDLDADGGIVWADFDEDPEQYFGTPFWGSDSKSLYVQWMPRRQNRLDVYKVSAADGAKEKIYHEEYSTWIDWIEGMLFGKDGLYMARNFETGWTQIYYLSYDGRTFRRLTEGENWDISLMKVDERKGDLWFTAKRDSRLHPTFYRLNRKGVVTALTDPEYWASWVKISDDGKSFTAFQSNARTKTFKVEGDMYKYSLKPVEMETRPGTPEPENEAGPVPEIVKIQNDGFDLYGMISYPKDYDSTKRYPAIMQLYGGPGTPYVRDRWHDRDASYRWAWENGIVYVVVDPRSSGENGRRGMDQAFRQMTVIELQDYIAWAEWLKSSCNVSRIGVEGFSFGGTTTAMLVLRYPEHFCCGVAGGGVYDWKLYDSHYTERFMDTPQANPDGYARATVLNYVKDTKVAPGALKLTHGTGDDNVHFQNTLQLIDALQKEGVQFELMIYPDGMHGYRGYQHEHDSAADHIFWTRHLLENK